MPIRAAEIRRWLSPVALAGIGVLVAATLTLVLGSLATPAAPELSGEVRYYIDLIGSVVAWVWMLAGLTLQIVSASRNDPIDAGGMFAVGVGLMFTFNGVVVHDPAASVALRVLGFLVLVATPAMLAMWHHFATPEVREAVRDGKAGR